MAIVDFTNPEACKWYKDELRKLIRMGADTFKTDFGERIPLDGVYYDGSDPDKMHNYYTHLYNRCVFEVLQEELGEKEANLFARSATAGGQQYPVHWGGDNEATYPSMAESLREACRFAPVDLVFGVMISAGLVIRPHRICTNVGRHLGCFPRTVDYMATHLTGCPGYLMKRQWMCFVSSHI